MRVLLTILFGIITEAVVQSRICEYYNSVELVDRSYNGVQYEDNEYFVDNVTGVERGCVCLKGICARKCCPPGQGYDNYIKQCVNIVEPFNPPVWDESVLKEGFNATKEFIFMFGRTNCTRDAGEISLPVFPNSEEFHLRPDGKLHVEFNENVPPVVIYGPDKYCIDTFIYEDDKPELNALICFVTTPENNNYILSSGGMLISCVFILLTVSVYAGLPELRNLHGMVLMAYLLSFFVGFLFMATMQILILKDENTQNLCTALTFIIYFSLLSAFFWLNVMCYDIWWTFSGKRTQCRTGSPCKRFYHYCLYAFGVPTVLTILLAALEFSDLRKVQHPLLPKLRLQGCFLNGNGKLIYFYGPIVVLCVANMTFFTLTALEIAKTKRQTAMLHSKDSSTHDQDRKDTQRFSIYVKLFALMGINWILEVVSSFYPDADFFWQFSDTYNVLVGLIIFIIFVCKMKTLKMIKKRINDVQRSNSDSREMKNVKNTAVISKLI